MIWGIVLIYLLRLNILHIYCLIKWLVVYKRDHQFHIKQVIISCEFCQHFKIFGSFTVFMDESVVFEYFGYVD